MSVLVGVCSLGICACDDGAPEEGVDADGWPNAVSGSLAAEAAEGYSAMVAASYADSVRTAEALEAAVLALVAAPSAASLADAREAWLASREPYLQTEAYRFYDGPIDNADDGPEGLINAWPLDEHYIDYVADDASAGIINGGANIDAQALTALNEEGGEKNIATGYHAIEFLLWGQDMDADGPGARPHTDYVTDGSGTADNQDRRGEYLTVVAGLLVEHLTQVRDAWGADADYRGDFEAAPRRAVEKMLTGAIVLSGFETGSERLQPALDNGDQEDEHSCFSDNTHRDMIQDVQGVLNVWRGSYVGTDGKTVSGVGLADLVEFVDADLAADVEARIETSLALANALQTPFDQEILADNADGNARVRALIESLATQEALLTEVFQAFGLAVPRPE